MSKIYCMICQKVEVEDFFDVCSKECEKELEKDLERLEKETKIIHVLRR